MLPNTSSQSMSPEDALTLRALAGRYGSGNLTYTLRSMTSRPAPQHHLSAPARSSAMSTSTFGSIYSAPSLTNSGPWSGSDASLCGSDAGSVAGSYFGQSPGTWTDTVDPAFIMSPSTPSLSGSDWQDAISPACDRKNNPKSPSARKPIECPICAVYDVYVGFGRKSDFKKHLQNFHATDNIWVCPHDKCRMIFDFEKAYVTHFKIDHGDAPPPPDMVRVELCPQVVFACGFIGCKEVHEASSDTDAAAAADKFFDHLAGHFDAKHSSTMSEWTYYHQIQNLLRQKSLKDEWKHTLWDKAARNQLRWQPRSSGDLKKLLECRHLADVPRILHAAWTLGQTSFSSPEHPAPEFPGEATRPLKHSCVFAGKNHSQLRIDTHFHAPCTSRQTIFSLRRGLFPVKLVTVSHPPPRSVPDEPDSLEYAHPGTPLVLPERDDWSTNVVLGPPEDEHLFDPLLFPGSGCHAAENPVAPWSQSTGDLTPSPESETSRTLLQVPSLRRHLSWGRRSLDNLRLKRRGDDKAALPTWI
ncbi:hypothetical protein Cob_v004858 [Colletotrichum orbiculare MAFF 240422]|uniref:Uncharacterized protein n=1 Tax=Colletotrichum orbiculare (strain 104-T / ATCC 96160 / CBS 514.97 / LARS 414 / MAFF 240422) TaxID=1213857 RepID=N4UVR1_COLOR|nr:hypothetical protein Cob_v004858 [Colletotrichum orbiculare MAFF 240422]